MQRLARANPNAVCEAHEPDDTLAYDKNGNLTDDGEKYKYVYNPFGQLVQITDRSSNLVAEYHYNGLGQRISEQTDTNRSGNTGIPDGTVDSNDPVFYIAVDQQGRRVATYRGTDTYPKETFVYHPDIARGPNFQGGVLLRDRYSGLGTTPSTWATAAGNATRDERHYYASDYRGNVVALLKSDGTLAEQYRYSSSGVPFGVPKGSVTGSGLVDATTSGTTDYTIVNAMVAGGAPAYEARGDLDLDGDVDSADLAIVTANNGSGTGRGKLSVAGVANHKSYGATELFGSGIETIGSSGSHAFIPGLGVSLSSNASLRYSAKSTLGANGPCSSCSSATIISATPPPSRIVTDPRDWLPNRRRGDLLWPRGRPLPWPIVPTVSPYGFDSICYARVLPTGSPSFDPATPITECVNACREMLLSELSCISSTEESALAFCDMQFSPTTSPEKNSSCRRSVRDEAARYRQYATDRNQRCGEYCFWRLQPPGVQVPYPPPSTDPIWPAPGSPFQPADDGDWRTPGPNPPAVVPDIIPGWPLRNPRSDPADNPIIIAKEY